MTFGTNGGTANASVNGGSTAFSAAKDVASLDFIPNVGPVNGVPVPQSTDEDTPLMLSSIDGTMITISDPDAGPSNVEVSLAVVNGSGILLLGSTFGITVTGGADGSPSISITGPVAYINAGLDGLLYVPAMDYNGPTSLTVTTNDLGNSGGGGPQSDVDVVTINVAAVNDPPVNIVPFQQSTPMNTPLVFSAGNSNALSIGDVDAGTNDMEVIMTATNGTLTIAGTTGLSFTVGDGTEDATMTFTGTISSVNAAIGTLTFLPDADYGGPAGFTITTDDQGSTGSGGAWASMGLVDIAVTTPFVAVAPRLVLEGPYSSGTGLMGDALRVAGMLPTVEPYTGLGYTHVGGGGETTTVQILAVTGNNAIVDWVVVELRDVGDPATVLATHAARCSSAMVTWWPRTAFPGWGSPFPQPAFSWPCGTGTTWG
ncbi:MAG: hypothetical protein IPL52_03035 [Flavobacteriales bacterium]|nr:hypothetical protein [Flavobacteriales bacterium]